MIPKPLLAITIADIDQLVADGVPESRTIEYKEELPGGSDTERKEFANDVCAFANAGGGDIIYGIAADDGVPKSVDGCTDAIADKVKLRLEQMISTSIRPRVRAEAFSVPGCAPPVFVLRIHPSFNTPHMVTNGGPSRFWMRGSAGKRHLDVDEIRQAFEMSGGVAERIREFRADRLMRIATDETPFTLSEPGRVVFHVVPATAGTGRGGYLDPHRAADERLAPLRGDAMRSRYNLDGFAVANRRNGPCYSYTQAFRSGAIESVWAGIVESDPKRGPLIPPYVAKYLIEFTSTMLQTLSRLGIQPPCFIIVSLLGVRAAGLGMTDRRRFETDSDGSEVFDRDHVLLPEVLLESLDGYPHEVLRPVLDSMWQAAGYPRCWYYDAGGNFDSSW